MNAELGFGYIVWTMERRTGVSTRAVLTLWIAAGGLLILSAVADAIADTVRGPGVGLGVASHALTAVALIVLALGYFGPGSVTSFRPVATIALLVLVVISAVAPYLFAPIVEAFPTDAIAANVGIQVLELVLAVIVALQIVRGRVVPGPWRWAPIWVLIAEVLSNAATLIDEGLPGASESRSATISVVVVLVGILGKCFLGILLVVLADRASGRQLPRAAQHS